MPKPSLARPGALHPRLHAASLRCFPLTTFRCAETRQLKSKSPPLRRGHPCAHGDALGSRARVLSDASRLQARDAGLVPRNAGRARQKLDDAVRPLLRAARVRSGARCGVCCAVHARFWLAGPAEPRARLATRGKKTPPIDPPQSLRRANDRPLGASYERCAMRWGSGVPPTAKPGCGPARHGWRRARDGRPVHSPESGVPPLLAARDPAARPHGARALWPTWRSPNRAAGING